MSNYAVRPGCRYPEGATPQDDGINFCLFSRHGTGVRLVLYAEADSQHPLQVIPLDPEINRTFFFWHVLVVGLRGPIWYAWQVDGPDDRKHSGHCFDGTRDLLDPWARTVSDMLWDRRQSQQASFGPAPAMRAMVCPQPPYDWEGDRPLSRPPVEEIIYELHVGGFTRHPSSRVGNPGTFAGLREKIPYLSELGITSVELMPVMAFDEQDVPESVANLGLVNYWGYSTHSFFSPHPGYCAAPHCRDWSKELKDTIKALHRAGIAVLLDVVFNHTAEGGFGGPVINFKGIDNRIFYHLEAGDRRQYKNFSGCGNTVNCNHPLVARFIIESLEFWVEEYHVDGFRFDLASILARGEDGEPMYHAPVVWSIEFSQILADRWLIAEAWDAGGLYQVGGFPGLRWAEWNGRYRDLLRRVVRGEGGLMAELATRLSGSSDLYALSGRLPGNSINFITCHDGFTLHDLISYSSKHNQANGEDNRDGESNNLSWNCGAEGRTDKPAVLRLRLRQAKNFMALLFLSQGVPMLLAGDEMLRSQGGNNNCWCQDNELSWINWDLLEINREMFRFTREMIAFRKRHPSLRRHRFLTGSRSGPSGLPDITWHGERVNEPPWQSGSGYVLAFTLGAFAEDEEDLQVMLNFSSQRCDVQLPAPPLGKRWHRAVDTFRRTPDDLVEAASQRPVRGRQYQLQPRTVVVLESR